MAGQIQHRRCPAQHPAYGQRVQRLGQQQVAGVDHPVGLQHQRLAGAQRGEGHRQGHQVPGEMDMDDVGFPDQSAGGRDQSG